MKSDVKDMSLAGEGRRRIEWAERDMPVLGLLKDRSALFIDGMELDMKERMTAEAGLVPLAYKCREIYSYARRHVPARWWRYCYGAEPYLVFRGGRQRRYGTIFLRDPELQGSSLSQSSGQEL